MFSLRNHVLCVDDDLDTCEVLQLSCPDIKFTFAHTVASGLEFIKNGVFDLYLLDTWLPDGSGLDLCREIRRADSGTPVIFLSAAAYAQDHQRAIDEGASDYLDKPADLFRVDATIKDSILEAEFRRLSPRVAAVSALGE